ncbi:metal ABC transporter solute-binding protein, Zn/Mn family [Bacillus safensis]|uniref:metal ABC transporter solute-binding protein, Zn/Mn family n=1 Tax=Bacillus safensis TaxID=561879 RepID=UPI0024535817|nr:zinc ABC transporter substrate-binding protein [Bacillus safensis]MDH3095337.1 zinc ABC transporter substrate-binding protein [Bacillus safensis]
MKKIFFILTAALFAIGLAACSSSAGTNASKGKADGKLIIYTTIFPIQDFTEKIGGSRVHAQSVYPANADAHTFEPSSKTMVEMAEGDAFIYSGTGAEAFAAKTAATLKDQGVKTVKAAEGIKLLSTNEEHAHEEGEDHDHEGEDHDHDGHDHGDKDPHAWLDPVYAQQMAKNIKDTLVSLDPDHKDEYTKNYEHLKKDLQSLDQEFKTTLSKAKHKEILVSHAAYGYWEKRYGIEQISVLGLSASEEPSQKQLENIVQKAEKHHIQYVIFENNVSSKVSDTIRSEIGAKSLTLKNLESITEDDVKNGESYVSLMKQNLKTLKTALND